MIITNKLWKILKEWESQITWPAPWEICMQVKKQHWTWNNRQVPNWERSTSTLYIVTLLIQLIFRVHYEKRLAGRSTSRIKIAGRNINNLRYTDDTTLMAEREEELKNLLMKVKEESEKIGLQFNTQKTKIMASSPITSGKYMGKQWKQW